MTGRGSGTASSVASAGVGGEGGRASADRHGVRAVLVGAAAFFAASVAFAMAAGPLDEPILESIQAEAGFDWRRFLTDEPPTFGSLLGAWLAHKAAFALGVALLFAWARPSLRGPGWRAGAVFGLATWPLVAATYAGQWTILTVPGGVWLYWSVYYLGAGVLAGACMGWAVDRFGAGTAAMAA